MSENRRRSDGAVPAVGILLAVLFGGAFAVFASIALNSRFGGGAGDPHGYGMLFGTFLALGAGLITALVVPLILPKGRRRIAMLASMICYLVVAAGLIAALLTA